MVKKNKYSLLHTFLCKPLVQPMTICLILYYDTFNRQEFLHDHSNVEFWIDSLDSRKHLIATEHDK